MSAEASPRRVAAAASTSRSSTRRRLDYFNERGFHGVSLAELAAELSVTKTALYHYVNKAENSN